MTRSQEHTAVDAAKKGSADLLILALVEEQALHGYEIARRIEARSGGTLRFTLASLYETLYRLEERGWIRGRWVETSRSAPPALLSHHRRRPPRCWLVNARTGDGSSPRSRRSRG